MVIYTPIILSGYEWINAVNPEDYKIFNSLDGTPLGEKWKPVTVSRVPMENGSECKESDFPGYSRWLIMRKRVVTMLRPLIKNNGELLPLKTDDDVELFIYNAHIVDGLDKEKSLIQFIPGTDRIMRVKQAVFLIDIIQGHDIFRLPYIGSSTYVSNNFREEYIKAGLVGLEFKEIWRDA